MLDQWDMKQLWKHFTLHRTTRVALDQLQEVTFDMVFTVSWMVYFVIFLDKTKR